MSRILLADESPHAQRMGESILRGEGFEVVTVTDGDTAALRLSDVDPDLVLVDVGLAKKNGYEFCQFVRSDPRFSPTRVILTAAATATLDEERARRVGADATLRKPFELTSLLEAARPLLEYARRERAAKSPAKESGIDREKVRAAVTLALDAAMPAMINELTEKVMASLKD